MIIEETVNLLENRHDGRFDSLIAENAVVFEAAARKINLVSR